MAIGCVSIRNHGDWDEAATHAGELVVDENNTFVDPIRSYEASLDGKVVGSDYTWPAFSTLATLPFWNALPVVGDCSYGLVVAAVLVPQGKP